MRRALWMLGCWLLMGCASHHANRFDHHPVGEPVQVIRVLADDGGSVVFSRRPNPGAPSVVLVHGISSNHRFFDLDEERSLALHLQKEGFDVWNLDLRGHGRARVHASGRPQHPKNLDVYASYDLPAAITRVLEETNADSVHFVGHSLGGMVLAMYLATTEDPPIASAVILSSPLDFRDPSRVLKLAAGMAPLGTVLPSLATPAGARMLGAWHRGSPAQQFLYNPALMEKPRQRTLLRWVVSPLYRGEIQHFRHILEGGEVVSVDGEMVYRDHLFDVQTPILFFAGRADRIVSPDRVSTFFDSVGSADKQFVVLSAANGHGGDFGHLDYTAADTADVDVYEPLTAWLRSHSDPGAGPITIDTPAVSTADDSDQVGNDESR